MLDTLYNAEQLALIRTIFELVFIEIASISTKSDKKIEIAYMNFINKSERLPYPLVKEILLNYNTDSVRHNAHNGKSAQANLKSIVDLIDSKIDKNLVIDLKKTLIAFAYYITSISGILFYHKFSNSEEDALHNIGNILGISVREIIRIGELSKILAYIE
ncbi:MAG TPA: hypothetical protein PLE30_05530 [Candidatus Kapabacteria bacterium]|nr:hypothetical protein [Candidatus Kapabacteria bacterium]